MDQIQSHTYKSLAVAACALSVLSLAGCQTYEPRPLDPEAHHAAWYGRTLEDSSLSAFIADLGREHAGEESAFDTSDGLSLREARVVALVLNPDLRLARLRVKRALVSGENAGLYADPQFGLDVLYVTNDVPKPWVVAPSLSFSIPLLGRLDAERGLAAAQSESAAACAREAEWAVWNQVNIAWSEWSAMRLRADAAADLVESMGAPVAMAARLAEHGELPRTEASLLQLEQAQRANQLSRMRGESAALEQRLHALLGLSPEAPVEFVVGLGVGEFEPATPERIDAGNPTLARMRHDYEVAEQTLRHEISLQLPDLSLGPQLEHDQGQTSVGFVGGVPLLFFNANRRGIAEARVGREIARATLETEYERLVGRWAQASASAVALAEQRADFEQALVPLVDAQIAGALERLRLGEGSSLVLLESLGRSYEIKLELIETRLAEELVRAELNHLVGPAVEHEAHASPEMKQ